MQKAVTLKGLIQNLKATFQDEDQTKHLFNNVKNFLLIIMRAAIIIGVGYVILSPVIGMVVNSISSNRDAYNPMVFVLPQNPTWERYALVFP